MALLEVMRPTRLSDAVGEPELIHGRAGKWDAPETVVWTRAGRMFKTLKSAQRLADQVGGYVKDYASGRILYGNHT